MNKLINAVVLATRPLTKGGCLKLVLTENPVTLTTSFIREYSFILLQMKLEGAFFTFIQPERQGRASWESAYAKIRNY